MKKIMALTFVVTLLLLVFASCSNSNSTPAPTETATPITEDTTPVENTPKITETSKSEFGFSIDANGIATEPYNYVLPLTTSDEVLSYWFTIWTPEYITESDFGETALPMEVQSRTGVNVEYVAAPSTNRAEAFSVLLAADNLLDIMCSAINFYNGTPIEMVEDGYFVNIYDYRQYMPNYLYQTTYLYPEDKDTHDSVFYYEDFIPAAYGLNVKIGESIGGFCFRQDWLDEVNMVTDDIVTWDDFYDALTRVKSVIDSCEYPLWLSQTLEMAKYWQFQSFGSLTAIPTTSLPAVYIKDGKVQLGCTTNEDKALMEKLNEFYKAGLINPDWSGYALPADFTNHTSNNEIACQYHGATGLADAKKMSVDPGCNWQPIQKPLLSEDQILHVGNSKGRVATGNCSFAAKNTNLELAMKWIDYRYSPEGWELYAYGPEGVVCYTDENGERHNTDWAVNNPDGLQLTWLVFIYSLDAFVEPGITTTENKLLHPGGEPARKAITYWTDWLNEHYDASGVYPVGARLTLEQSETLKGVRTDVVTFIAENFSSFLDGSKSFSEWDSYVEGLNNIGLKTIIDVYQEAYEAYLQRVG